MKKRTSHSISDEGKELLRQLAAKMGLSQAGVIEVLIREEARRNQETIADEWNRTNPVGTKVRYYPNRLP